MHGGNEVTGEGLGYLSRRNELEVVGLHCSEIKVSGFRYITGMKRLKTLDIGTGRGAASERPYEVPATQADDNAVQYLKEIKCLKSLNISGTKISKHGDDQLRRAIPALSIHRW